MITLITENIKVSVSVDYRKDYSSPNFDQNVFTYKIKIENIGNRTVQLLKRHWYIFDSNGKYREVKGDGVIGQQPVIPPSGSHEYQSAVDLKTDIGMMWGTYLMRNKEDRSLFEVKIPEFQLICPCRLN